MNEVRNRFLCQMKQSLDNLAFLLGHKPPPFGFGLALDMPSSVSNSITKPALTYGSVQEMIKDMSIVFGVPKYRTSKPKKVTRKFSFSRLLKPVENLVTCPTCSNIHPSDTICEQCYEKVRSLTNDIKEKMMNYNPYVGEKQDKEIFVRFRGEAAEKNGEVVKGKRVVELDKERPSWFKKLTLRKE